MEPLNYPGAAATFPPGSPCFSFCGATGAIKEEDADSFTWLLLRPPPPYSACVVSGELNIQAGANLSDWESLGDPCRC